MNQVTCSLRNTVIHGGCVSVLPQLATCSVDFVLADPPYVCRYKTTDGRVIPNDGFKWMKPGFAELYPRAQG
jgi:DNA modification methylase